MAAVARYCSPLRPTLRQPNSSQLQKAAKEARGLGHAEKLSLPREVQVLQPAALGVALQMFCKRSCGGARESRHSMRHGCRGSAQHAISVYTPAADSVAAKRMCTEAVQQLPSDAWLRRRAGEQRS